MNTTKDVKPNKVCPVLLRNTGDDLLILAFRHPIAGYQLVKGTIELGESDDTAALRELFEESGIDSANIVRHLGIWKSDFENQIWSIYLCETAGLPDEWIHHTQDEGGLDFAFFWQSLNNNLDSNWHPLYQEALHYIKDILMSAP